MAFDSGVNAPGGASYAPPLLSFSQFANWKPDDPYAQVFKQQQEQLNAAKVQQAQQQTALSQAFPNGLPTDPRTGAIDYGQVARTLAKFGDIGGAVSLIQNQPAPSSPMFGGAGQPQGGAPVAPAGPAPSSVPAQPAAAQPASPMAPAPNPSGGTVSALASSVGAPSTVAQNVAKAIGVDPGAPLSDAQQQRASGLLQGYAQRQSGAGLQRLQSAIFGQESSSGRNTQTSVTGARGGMQIEPGTFKQYATAGENIDNPADNQAVGNRILADYWKRYNGDPARAAVAYFSGPGNVAPPGSPTPWKKDSADPTGKTTSSYVNDILRKMGVGQLRQAIEPANPRVAEEFNQLPPSLNAVSPRPSPGGSPSRAAGAAGAPAAALSSAPSGVPAPQPQQVAQQPAQPAQQPVQAQQQPAPQPQQPHPIGPQEPLPPGYTDPQKAVNDLRAEANRYALNPNRSYQMEAKRLDDWATRIEVNMKPISPPFGRPLIDPRSGKTLYQSDQPTLAPSAVEVGAQQYFQTGKLPSGLGYGTQRAANIGAIMDRADQIANAEGVKTEDLPARWQAFNSQSAGQRMLSQRATNLRLAENEASSLIPRVRELSAQINRTNYPSLNKIILAAKQGTGDPTVVRFGISVASLIPVYARVLKPTGQINEGDTKRASDILEKAWADGQINGALDQMEIELQSAKGALNKTINEQAGRGGKTDQGGAPKTPASTGGKPQGTTSSGLKWSVE